MGTFNINLYKQTGETATLTFNYFTRSFKVGAFFLQFMYMNQIY